MPTPTLQFDDEATGLPPQAVPVRFACMAANWHPALFSELVTGIRDIGPLLRVYEYDATKYTSGEVHPVEYQKYLATKTLPLCDALDSLPANHFVWSNDLVQAYSDYVDLALDREYARQSGLGIRWNPTLGGCENIIAASTDLSRLNKSVESKSSLRLGAKACVAYYNGTQGQFSEDKGLHYIITLLKQPNTEFSVQDLERIVNPHSPTDLSADAYVDKSVSDDDSTENIQVDVVEDSSITTGHLGFSFSAIDDRTKRELQEKIKVLDENIADADERCDDERKRKFEDERDDIAAYLSANLNHKGKPRQSNSTGDKIRKAIWSAISRTITRIKDAHPTLGEHLEKSIDTGFSCCYRPTTPIKWEITIIPTSKS